MTRRELLKLGAAVTVAPSLPMPVGTYSNRIGTVVLSADAVHATIRAALIRVPWGLSMWEVQQDVWGKEDWPS